VGKSGIELSTGQPLFDAQGKNVTHRIEADAPFGAIAPRLFWSPSFEGHGVGGKSPFANSRISAFEAIRFKYP